MNKIDVLVNEDLKGVKFNRYIESVKDEIDIYGFDNILKDKRIKIKDSICGNKEVALLASLGKDSKTKIGRIASLLKLNKDISYSEALQTKELNPKEILTGNFDEIYPILRVTTNVGWHKSSQIAKNDEAATFHRWVDATAINIAKDVILTSENSESESHPTSGLILAIQGLRIKGYTPQQIKGLAETQSIVDEVYMVYNGKISKPRSGVYGAREIETMLKRHMLLEARGGLLGWEQINK